MWYITMILILCLLTMVNANLDFLDIGLEYSKMSQVYYWTSPITIQLVYQIPKLPSVDEFKKPRCDFALSARKSLSKRFGKQFHHVAKLDFYKENCRQFTVDELYKDDTERQCYKCFHISSDNDPFYLECLTLIEMRHLCTKSEPTARRRKRDTKDSYVLSNIAVMLAGTQKTQDDRITAKFRTEHNLQKENVNFQLLFLNTFRWQMSMSELWFLHYIQSDQELFAKILIHLSGVIPKTKQLTENKINSSVSDEWTIKSTNRNETHVMINVTFTSYHAEFMGQLYRFRYLPVKFSETFYALNSQDAFVLKCDETVVQLDPFDANLVSQKKFVEDSPCHQNHETSGLQECMKNVMKFSPKVRELCLKNARKLHSVNDFYFTTEYKIWFSKEVQLSYDCGGSVKYEKEVKPNSLFIPKCGCTYKVNGKDIPKTKTCTSKQFLTQVKSNFTFRNEVPFFLGEMQDGSNGEWSESASNKLAAKTLIESEAVQQYFERKLKEEASTSAAFQFKFGVSSLWFLLPLAGLVIVGVIFFFKCRTRANGLLGGMPQPVYVNYCQHTSPESVSLRPPTYGDTIPQPARVVSWAGPGRSTKV